MRITIIITAIILSMGAYGQNIPDMATEDFNARFNHHTEATNIKWKVVENGYVVNYDFNDRHGFVFYNDQGMFKESKLSMEFKELEQGVKDYINTTYESSEIIYCFRLNTQTAPERSVVQLESNGELINVYFRPDGTFHYEEIKTNE